MYPVLIIVFHLLVMVIKPIKGSLGGEEGGGV